MRKKEKQLKIEIFISQNSVTVGNYSNKTSSADAPIQLAEFDTLRKYQMKEKYVKYDHILGLSTRDKPIQYNRT